jgi:hypothetical protein
MFQLAQGAMVQVKLVVYVGHVTAVAAGFVQIAQGVEALSGKSMLVLGERLSEGRFALIVKAGEMKFAQCVMGMEGSLKFAQCVLELVAYAVLGQSSATSSHISGREWFLAGTCLSSCFSQ